jgi:ABC transporter substrate-binding protein PnrA-like
VELSQEHPDVSFVQIPGWQFFGPEVAAKLVGADGRLYQAYYLCGLVMGSMTERSHVLGVVSGVERIPLVVNAVNAIAIGARTVNPLADVRVIYMNDWIDERLRRQAADQLVADHDAEFVFALAGSTVPDVSVASAELGGVTGSAGFAGDFRSHFAESSSISLALYNIVIVQLIMLPLIYTMEDDEYAARTVLLAALPMYHAATTLILLFAPKLWVAIVRPDKNASPSLSESHMRSGRRTRARPDLVPPSAQMLPGGTVESTPMPTQQTVSHSSVV